MSFKLGELAKVLGAQVEGDADCRIEGVATLDHAQPGELAFLANSKYHKYLAATKASAVILRADDAPACPGNALISDNPYLAYARAAELFEKKIEQPLGRHPSAVVDESAKIADGVRIGPGVVIEADVEIGAGVSIGPGCVVGCGACLGDESRLLANVTLCHGVQLGKRVLVHPGAVIGSDGFGQANDEGSWVKVPQLGSVRIGDDVEIGANTTIDRGAVDDTVIENGVKLDNQIQIAHNVHIGAHTAIAACVGIAGSTRIGKHCTLAGGVGVVGHLVIGDNVHFSAQTLVTRSFLEPGYYSGNLPAVPNNLWRRTIARIRRLDTVLQRFKGLEKRLNTVGVKKEQ